MPKILPTVGRWLDECPNLYVEIASRIAELGRQPFTARRFLLKYQDRVLFGTDGPWPEERVRLYWRFLETDDEYFPVLGAAVSAARVLEYLRSYQLPDEVLRKLYRRERGANRAGHSRESRRGISRDCRQLTLTLSQAAAAEFISDIFCGNCIFRPGFSAPIAIGIREGRTDLLIAGSAMRWATLLSIARASPRLATSLFCFA